MPRLLLVLAVIAVALMVFTIVDVSLTDARRARGVPKGAWLLIVLLPILGPILWFSLGKEPAGAAPQHIPLAPDDDPSFLQDLRRHEEQDERIRRLEQELADLDDDPPAEK
jgi:hypothetical protein